MCSISAGVAPVSFIVASMEICFVLHLMITLAFFVIASWWCCYPAADLITVFFLLCCYFQQTPIKGLPQMFPSACPCILYYKVSFCFCCFSLLTCLLFVKYSSPPLHWQCCTHTFALTFWFKTNYRPVLVEFHLQPPSRWSFPFSKTCCQLAFSQFLIHHVLVAFVTNFSYLTMHISYHDRDIFLVSRQISSTTVTKRNVIRLVWLILAFANCVNC